MQTTNNRSNTLILDTPDLAIHIDSNGMSTVYDPKKRADIKKLCHIAKLEQFIHDCDKKNYPRLLIFENKRYNRGVIAAEPIKKGQYIGEYLGELNSIFKTINRNHVKNNIVAEFKCANKNYSSDELKAAIDAYIQLVTAYAFEVNSKSNSNDCILAHRKRSLVAFINHNSTDPNVTTEIKKNTIYYLAERDIAAGEQLRIDYGPDYDYHEYMSYIPCTENHLLPGKFLAENIMHYYSTPKKLSKKQMQALSTSHQHVMLPLFLKQIISKKNTPTLSEYIKRLPIIEVDLIKNTKNTTSRHQLFVPNDQQNISVLMYALSIQNVFATNILIEDYKVDKYAKTLKDRDALFVALNMVESEHEFIKLAGSLLKKLTTQSLRVDELSSDNFGNSLLHDLVLREWCNAIALFNKRLFFAVVDKNNYDPLLAAIAHGKLKALQSLLKLRIVKNSLQKLLLAGEMIDNDYRLILARALKEAPTKTLPKIKRILINAANSQHLIRQLNKLFTDC